MSNESLQSFILNPIPTWKKPNLDELIQAIFSLGIDNSNLNQYSNFNYLTNSSQTLNNCGHILKLQCGRNILIENPVPELSAFYYECGLNSIEKEELLKGITFSKIKNAFAILKRVPDCYECIFDFVKSITIVKSEGPDYDTSYSHPNLPLSIFFSLCIDDDEISSLRVAESILHEAMHLKLSLIEKRIQLIKNPENTFFSPWRDETRPIGGVLHGLFVFTAILNFYRQLLIFETSTTVIEYLQLRCKNIEIEMAMIIDFPKNGGLTKDGETISRELLRYCILS